jgi:O-acetylserine/cysteine efflux transporter
VRNVARLDAPFTGKPRNGSQPWSVRSVRACEHRAVPLAHLALVLLVCLAWGGNFLTSAYALEQIPPFLFTALRLGVVLVALLPWLRPIPRDQWPRLVAVGLLTGSIHFGFNFWALQEAGAISSIAILLQCYIPMSASLAWLLLGERFGWRTALGVAIAFGGVLVLGFDPLVMDAPKALVLALVAAATLALGTTLMRGLRGVGTFELQAWSAAIGIPLLLPVSWWLEGPDWARLAEADLGAWGGVVYAGLVASVVGHGILYFLVQRHPIARITPYLLLAPLVAIALGVLVWGDEPGPRLIAGGAMVLGGVLVISVRGLRRGRVIQPAD